MIVYEQLPVFRDFLEASLEFQLPQDVKTLANKGEGILAVVGFYHYAQDNDIELAISTTSPRWATKDFLRAVFNYAFITANCHRCTARVKADNTKAIKLVEKLGFQHEGTAREALDRVDVHIYGLLKHECRWIDE